MSEVRVIKKYPNRRLYDTEVSKYITLEDVRQLVLDAVPFMVQDAKTKADLTRSILLQIIMEREEGGAPLFSEQVLSEFIRFYGGSMQGPLSEYLEKTMSMVVSQQAQLQEQMQSLVGKDPMSVMREAAERNMGVWQEMQENFLRAGGLGGFGLGAKSGKPGNPTSGRKKDDI